MRYLYEVIVTFEEAEQKWLYIPFRTAPTEAELLWKTFQKVNSSLRRQICKFSFCQERPTVKESVPQYLVRNNGKYYFANDTLHDEEEHTDHSDKRICQGIGCEYGDH